MPVLSKELKNKVIINLYLNKGTIILSILLPDIGYERAMVPDSESGNEKRSEDMALNEKLEVIFKRLRENTKALEELKEKVDSLTR